jgi:protein-S-isoprenylcysteine O-methyltransferase Ste14
MTARDQSSFPAACSSASSSSCSCCQTPAVFHSSRRRQHVMPEPNPSSCGRNSRWMPVCSTKKIPHSTCRSGTALAVLGLALAVAGVAAVIRHRTTIVPHHRVATLLTGGAYGLSRNPMYTGLAIAYLGLALLLDSWWTLALWPLVIVAVRQLVIRPEEQYLTQRFGRPYTDYQCRVRRWL